MNKFLLSAATVAIAVSASATGLQGFNVPQTESKLSNIENRELPDPATTLKIKVENQNVFTRDRGPADFEGNWTFTFGDYYLEGATDGPLDYVYTAQYDPSLDIYVFFSNQAGLPMAAIYDAANEVFQFPIVNWGLQGEYYAFQRPFHYNDAENTLDYLNILYGYYDAKTGIMSFDPEEGISWEAFMEETGDTFVGWYRIWDLLSASNQNAGVDGIEIELAAPVYYDILGNKVTNPKKGQILIQKTGNISRKVVY